MWGFGKKKEEPKKEETKVEAVKKETTTIERKVGDTWIGEFSGTKITLVYNGPVGEYPGWKK
tara:strand:+ start:178 stop:363 length:186 start_codon:yes stop_codon:yes gene_type:complete